jgi:hypothetical protein
MSDQKRAITLIHESDLPTKVFSSIEHKYQDVIDAIEQTAGDDLWACVPIDNSEQVNRIRSSLSSYFTRHRHRRIIQRYDKKNKLLYIRIAK